MSLTKKIALVASVLAIAGLGCKSAEKKRRKDGESAAASEPGKTAQTPVGGSKAPAANPHGVPSSPHGGPGPTGPTVGGKVTAGPTAADGTKVLGPMSLVVPKTWKESPPSSGMRLAQWAIGESDPAELVAFHFPGGGSIDANLDRWYGQFTQADGSSSKDKANRKDENIGGLAVTTVSVKGHYVAAMRPGEPGKHDKADHQMLAAIIMTEVGPVFFKMIGPEKTVSAAEKDWAQMINSIKKK